MRGVLFYPLELTEGVISRDESMIAGLPDDDPEKARLRDEVAQIERRAEDWLKREREAAAIQMVTAGQFLNDLSKADDPEKLRRVITDYFEGETPGSGLILAVNALRLRTSRDEAERMLYALGPKDRIAARVIDIKARKERRSFHEKIEREKEQLREEMGERTANVFEEEGKEQLEQLSQKITERLRPLLEQLPEELLTQTGREDYITRRIASFKDPLRRAAFKLASHGLRSAEEALGVEITRDSDGKITGIDEIKPGEKNNLFGQIVTTELIIDETRKKLESLQERVQKGDLSVISSITAMGEFLNKQIKLQGSLESLLKARLGVGSVGREILDPHQKPERWQMVKELLRSVNVRKALVEFADTGVKIGEAGVAAALVYAASQMGADQLHEMAVRLGEQLQVAPQQLEQLLQQAAQGGRQFAEAAEGSNIPAGDVFLREISNNWANVHKLEEFMRTAPGLKTLYESLSSGLHNAAPALSAIAAGVSLGRERVSSVIGNLTNRIRRRS